MPPIAAARSLERRLAKPGPGPGLTWGKVWFVLPITGAFDLLRFLFASLIFTAPFLIGAAAGLAAGAAGYGATTAKVVGAVAGVLGAGLELVPGVAEGVEALGVLMAMIIGIAGFIFIALLLSRLGVKLSGRNSMRIFLIFVGGAAPIVDIFPSLTPLTYHILHDQIKEDQKKVAAHKAEQAQLQAQLRQLRLAEQQRQVLQLQAAEQAQEEEELEAANDNEAIPEDMQQAA